MVEIRQLHPWDVSQAEAEAIQRRLARQVIAEGEPQDVRIVAGADIALPGRDARGKAAVGRGVVVLLSYPDLTPIEQVIVEREVTFPYIPGLLAFREVPVLAEAFVKLSRRPDLLIVDGQGTAHQRRFGIACHLGLLLDVPSIGCAKSRLTGVHDSVDEEAGSMTPLRDRGEIIGMVVRTRSGVKPLYVSVGHRISLNSAVEWVLRLCRGYRLPEPTRLADQLAGGRPLDISTSGSASQQMSLF